MEKRTYDQRLDEIQAYVSDLAEEIQNQNRTVHSLLNELADFSDHMENKVKESEEKAAYDKKMFKHFKSESEQIQEVNMQNIE